MDMPFIKIDAVAHVGSLDPTLRGVANKASLEAFCLSVSLDPEAWRGIARCGGAPTWMLSRPGSSWLDVCSLSDNQEDHIATWGIENGYATRETLWRVWFYDDEADDFRFMIFEDRESALHEAGEDWEEGGPDRDPAIESFDGLVLTQRGVSRLERWVDPEHGLEGLVILYADEVLSDLYPDMVGLWWNEEDNPLSLSCPRGGILPSRIQDFEITQGWDREPEDFRIDL